MLTVSTPGDYIDRYGAPSALRRDDAPSKLLTDISDMAPDSGRRRGVSTALRRTGGRGRSVPGCLTGESEERETWTAESLRAICSDGSLASKEAGFRRTGGQEETSAVDVSGQHQFRNAAIVCAVQTGRMIMHAKKGGTSSNGVTCREKVLIQLESLILAQSERWRQA